MKKVLKTNKFYIFLIITIFVGIGCFLWSQKTLGQGNVTVEGDSIVAQDVKIYGGETISGYEAKTLNWNEIQSNMDNNIGRLVDEYGIESTNPAVTIRNLNPNNKPEGQVWYVNGDVNLGGQVTGKGTFVIFGNLTINGDLTYSGSNDSIGFIVLNRNKNGSSRPGAGIINIGAGVSNLVGAYYSSESINFE